MCTDERMPQERGRLQLFQLLPKSCDDVNDDEWENFAKSCCHVTIVVTVAKRITKPQITEKH
jgi:hypothetical protein